MHRVPATCKVRSSDSCQAGLRALSQYWKPDDQHARHRLRIMDANLLNSVLIRSATYDVPALGNRRTGGHSAKYVRSTEIRADSTWLKLCYSRPSARGRRVFGDLVPYDTLWRTGANEATVLHTSRSASVAGVEVGTGKYSIYTVPGRDEWSLVINGTTGQWGLTGDAFGACGNFFENA